MSSFEHDIYEFEAALKQDGNAGTQSGASVYRVCPQSCAATKSTPLHVSKSTRELANIDKVLDADVLDDSSLDLFDPPIPIIGTDKEHARNIYASDVAIFQAHVNIWRDLFHGNSNWTFVVNCRVTSVEQILRQLLENKLWDQMTSAPNSDGFAWEMLAFAVAQPQEAGSNVQLETVHIAQQIHIDDIHAYALSKRGSEILLSHTRAFTLPLHEFLSAVLAQVTAPRVGRTHTTSITLSKQCEKRTRFVASDLLPFYPPLHWTYTMSSFASPRTAPAPAMERHIP
ncbi:unnamed protein product [Agarophyton chilense]